MENTYQTGSDSTNNLNMARKQGSVLQGFSAMWVWFGLDQNREITFHQFLLLRKRISVKIFPIPASGPIHAILKTPY